MFLLCLVQFTFAENEEKVKVAIVFHQVQQNDISNQIERRVKQTISSYQSVEIREILIDTTYQLTELFELMYGQGELDFLFIPCYNSDDQTVRDECTFYRYDVKNFVESSYTFSLNSVDPKSMAAYLDQKFILPIFSSSNQWATRILIFGSIVGAFYLAQTWIDVDFSGTGTIDSDPGGGSH